MEDLGFEDSLRAYALATEEDAIQTAAIEGENLDREKVRSSIAVHLGLPAAGLRPAADGGRSVERVAGRHTSQRDGPHTGSPLRLTYGTFPSGHSGLQTITTGVTSPIFLYQVKS